MTDTSTQPTVADSLNTALKSAPELGASPGLAVGIATSGGNTAGRAQAVARGTNAVADSTAKQAVQSSVGSDISGALNWFGNSVAHVASDAIRPVEAAVKPAASDLGRVLNAPMQYVQHEYRYLHDVEARHGQLAALAEGLGLAAGAAGGFALGGGYGAELGAEAAGAIEGQVAYRDSWQRTANGAQYTDPHTHRSVSLGRDVVSALGLRPGTLTFNVGSGLIDGIADLQVGGTEVAGLVGRARSVEGASGLLGQYFPGISAATAEDFEQSYLRYGSVQRTMQDIAGKSAGEIIATPAYQSLQNIVPRASTAAPDVLTGNDFVKALGNANTADDVAGVFRDALRTHELVGMDTIPTLSFTRVPFQALREQAENSPAGLQVARNFIRLPSAADETGAISMKAFDPTSTTDNGAVALYRTLMYTENRRVAASVVDQYINSNVAGKIMIYRNSMMNTLLAMTKEFHGDVGNLDANDMKGIKQAIDTITGGAEPGAVGWMGVDDTGRNLSYAGDSGDGDRQYAMAITDNQTGKLRIISLSEMRSMAHGLAGYKGLFGHLSKADDFLYNDITQRYFKPLVLLTPSYAMHIALAELIPNALRLGVRNMVKAGIAVNAAKLGTAEMNDEQISAISGLAWRLVGGHRASTAAAIIGNPEQLSGMRGRIQLAARYIDLMGGDSIAPGLSSGHNLSAEVDQEFRKTNLLRPEIAQAPMMRSNEFAAFGRADEGYKTAWHEWLNTDLVKDEKTQIAASALRNSLQGTRVEEIPNDIPAAEMYHGTPRALEGGQLNQDRYGAGASSNLFGPGVYTTDNPDVALSYTGKGARGVERAGELNKTVYGLHWSGAEAPHLIDMEAAAPPELRTAFSDLVGSVDSLFPEAAEDDLAEIERLVADPSASGASLYKAFSDMLQNAGVTRTEADEAFHDLTDRMEAAGYDGYRYQGGVRASGSGIRHEAKVFFDPQKLTVDRGTTVGRTVTRATSLDEASQDAAASVSRWLHEQPQSYLDKYDRALATTKSVAGDRPLGTDQLDDWAHVTVANLRGATRAAEQGPMNTSLLDHIANGEHVPMDELDAIPNEMRPMNVKGRKFVPAPPSGGVRAMANWGFQKVLNPMVNFISREPIAFAEFERQYARLIPQITGGVMGEDEAMTVALAKTSAIVIRNVHNLTDRTQWTTTLRNWAPFFFAQEQAYRRMGRLLAENPAAFRKYQLMISNVHDVGQVLGGQNGQSYFVIPGTGFMTAAIPEAMNSLGLPVEGSTPIGMGWNLNSMSVVFPTSNGIRPDLGPVVAVPIQAIADFFPEMGAPALKADVNAAASAAIGSAAMTSPIWEQLVPNTIVDRLLQAATADQGGTILADRSFASTMMQTMAMLDYEGKLPTGPTTNPIQLQTVANRIRNQTRIMYIIKALLGAITPVSPEVQVQGSNLRTEYDADAAAWNIATTGQGTLASEGFSMNQLGFPAELNADIKSEGSLTKGIMAYLGKHPDATASSVFEQTVKGGTPFTVSQSSAPSGAYITASVQAEQWMNDHASLISKYPMAAFYLMPQLTDTKYNPAIYNEQLAQGYRVKLNPSEAQGVTGATPSFLQQLYIAAGNAQFFGPNGPYTKYEASIAGMTASQKYPLEQQFYNVTLPQFQKQNPIWGQYWTSDTKQQDRDQAVSELQAMFRTGDAPPGEQTDEIKGLLKDYETYQSQLTWGSQNNFAVEKKSSIDQGWTDYLQAVAESHPELKAFVEGVFMTLPAQAAS